MAEDKKPNILFETLNALFTNKEYINNLSKESIKQNIFMINRRIAIKYPLQAQVFNNNKVNSYDVLKFWQDFLYTGTRPPGWIYTAGAVKSQKKKADKTKITQQMISYYSTKNRISKKDIQRAIDLFGIEMIDDIIDTYNIKKQTEEYEKADI